MKKVAHALGLLFLGCTSGGEHQQGATGDGGNVSKKSMLSSDGNVDGGCFPRAQPVTIGSPSQPTLTEAGQSDTYCFEAQPGAWMHLALDAAAGSALDAELTVYDAACNAIASADQGYPWDDSN